VSDSEAFTPYMSPRRAGCEFFGAHRPDMFVRTIEPVDVGGPGRVPAVVRTPL